MGIDPALRYFVDNKKSAEEVLSVINRHFVQELTHRLRYKNLKIRGWEVSENSVKPPTFTDEKIVSLTEQLYEIRIVEPKIVALNVELPLSRNLW